MDDSIASVICWSRNGAAESTRLCSVAIHLNETLPCILAVGAHLKNSVALSVGKEIFISQHIGDLETSEAFLAFRKTTEDLPRLYET